MQSGCFDSCFRTRLERFPSPNHYPPTARKPCITMNMLQNHKHIDNPQETMNSGRNNKTLTRQYVKRSVINYQERPITQYPNVTAHKTFSFKNEGAKIAEKNPPFIPKIIPFQNSGISFVKPASNRDSILVRQQKHSSLYGGAKGIIGKMSGIFQKDKNQSVQQVILEYKNVSTEVNNEKECSSIVFEWGKVDTNPFEDISLSGYKCGGRRLGLRKGKMLGRGKYCHAYLCQDPNAHFIFTLKEIFKQQSLLAQIYPTISKGMMLFMKIDHPNIVSCYSYMEDNHKITILQQYTTTLLIDQINKQGTLSPSKIKTYLKNIIEAIVMLHDCEWVHGNLNPNQIGCGFGVCKVRLSLTEPYRADYDYLSDIHAIGYIGYEMAYGLLEDKQNDEAYLPQKTTYRRSNLEKLITDLLLQKTDAQGKDLRNFIEMLLSIKENQRLSASVCFNHPFFL